MQNEKQTHANQPVINLFRYSIFLFLPHVIFNSLSFLKDTVKYSLNMKKKRKENQT